MHEPHEVAGFNPCAASPAATASSAPQRVSLATLQVLRETRGWMLFIAVLMFIVAGLLAISLAFIVAIMPSLGTLGGEDREGRGSIDLLGPVVNVAALAVFYVVSAILLWRYAARIAMFTRRPESRRLDAALAAQRTFWLVSGVLLLALLGMYAVLFVGGWLPDA